MAHFPLPTPSPAGKRVPLRFRSRGYPPGLRATTITMSNRLR